MSRVACGVVSLAFVISTTNFTHGQVIERGATRPAGGFQLKYVPIPPKNRTAESAPNTTEKESTPEKDDADRAAKEYLKKVAADAKAWVDAKQLATGSDEASEKAQRLAIVKKNWSKGGVYDHLFTPEETLAELERLATLPADQREKEFKTREELNQLWGEAKAVSGDYDKRFTIEELNREIAEVKALPPDGQKAVLKSRIQICKQWNAAKAASQIEMQQEQERQQRAAYNAWAARQQQLSDAYEDAYVRARAEADVRSQQGPVTTIVEPTYYTGPYYRYWGRRDGGYVITTSP